jgi:ABC-type transport system substrate-binding protein
VARREDALVGDLPLAFGISVAAGSSEANLISQILQEQWKAIALDVEINKAPQQLVADVVQKHDFEVWVGQVSQNPDPDFMTQLFHSANANLGNINFTDYRNPRIDKLFDDARATTDEAKRNEMYRKIQNIRLDDLPSLRLSCQPTPWRCANACGV